MQTNTPKPTTTSHHHIRTFFASFFGFIGISLVMASILVVWANRTITNTDTYVKTVAPLATKPEIQKYIATKISDALVDSASPEELSSAVLTAQEKTGKTPEQLTELVHSTIHDAVGQVLTSPAFMSAWEQTNRTAHAQLLSQIKSNSPRLTLDLSPIVNTVVSELKHTKLAGVADKLELDPATAVVKLEGSSIQKAHTYYDDFQKVTAALVVLSVVCVGLAIGLSVHHVKTLRRIALALAVWSGVLTIALQAPSFISTGSGSDDAEKGVVLVVARGLFKNLQIATLTISLVCLAIVIGSKLYQRMHKS